MSILSRRPRVLVVDDEPPIIELVRSYLAREAMDVLVAEDGTAALEIARTDRPDVVILDLMLPGVDGIEVCRQLRTFSDAYVILLTARAEEVDKLVGLAVGADDYVVKPFSPRELVARVKAVLRRPRASAEQAPGQTVHVGDLAVDMGRREVSRENKPVSLTAIEFDLLAAMARDPGTVITRQRLLDAVWGSNFYGDDHLLDVHIGKLRRKLRDDPAQPRYLETVRGIGFRLMDR